MYMLSTADNPFDPFTQYDAWFQWDDRAGYHSPSLLARVALVSEEMSEADQQYIIDQAIEEIVEENFSGMHIKVSEAA